MPRSPRAACARISARQAPSCARSICSSRCAAGIAASGSTCSRSSASATVRARSRSRSRSVVSQASKVGIDAVEVLQQVAIQQRQRGRLVGGRPHHLLDVHPDEARAEREVIAGDHQDLGRRPATALPAADGSPGAARRGPVPPAGGSTAVRPAGRAAPDAATTARSRRAVRGSCARRAARSRWSASRLPSGRSAAAAPRPDRPSSAGSRGPRVGVKCQPSLRHQCDVR